VRLEEVAGAEVAPEARDAREELTRDRHGMAGNAAVGRPGRGRGVVEPLEDRDHGLSGDSRLVRERDHRYVRVREGGDAGSKGRGDPLLPVGCDDDVGAGEVGTGGHLVGASSEDDDDAPDPRHGAERVDGVLEERFSLQVGKLLRPAETCPAARREDDRARRRALLSDVHLRESRPVPVDYREIQVTGEIALTVGIATRNRRDVSLRTLDSVVNQLGPADELLVVDTGSTDGTYEAVERWLAERRATGRVFLEAGAGVSRARNALIREASMSVMCFLDDDARAEPGWVEAIREAWRTAGKRVAAIGGPIRPDWGAPRPGWLPDYLLFILSILDLGPHPRLLDQQPGRGYVWGGNMTVRVDAVRTVGGFDPNLGSRPESPQDRGEEQDLQRRLAEAGYETWYEPTIVARHYVPAERVSEEYFAAQLRTRAAAEAREVGGPHVFDRFVRAALRYVLGRFAGPNRRTLSRLELTYGWNLLRARFAVRA
jgi:glucosyl-dolichyl phosphate glucuronosyltransferase